MARSNRNFFTAVLLVTLAVAAALLISACNLTSTPQEAIDTTDVPTTTVLPTRTSSAPTPVTVTALPGFPTLQPPASTPVVVLPPTSLPFPTSTPLPISIFILSPVPGSVVAGNVQVLGAAVHPQFLQYQLEYGPDPNPGNLWYPVSGIVQTPVVSGILGIWNTTVIQDSVYQLRLRVTLRDGTSLITVANSIRIQNQAPTPVPTATTVPRPIAAFTQDRVTGQAPLVVRFFNQSTGNVSSYSWSFGDGGSSPEVNPVHTFRNPGVYTVQLTVTGPGGSSNVSRQINVVGATPPVAAFTQDRTSGQSPLTVRFTDQSTGAITARTWSFGDGTTSAEASPAHTFTAVGTYNVILTVSGPGGSSSVTRQITVQNPTIPAPIAALVPSQTSGNAPLTVQFDASDSSGQIDSFNWDFGDGQLGTGRIVTHTFTNAGEYVVRLLVVGPGGQSTAQTTITAVRPPDAPVAAFTADPTSGNIPLAVQFDASGSTGPIDSYTWDFGDGQSGSGVSPSHTFTAPGTYTVELTVSGPGGTSSMSAAISATEPIAPPDAAFEINTLGSHAPLDVEFINQTSGESLTFNWNFGDGTTSTERAPRHTFTAPGTYTITLAVEGPGGTDTAEQTFEVSPAPELVASFTVNPPGGEAPLKVQLEAAQSPNLTAYAWTFSDGGTATGPSANYTFANPGDYTVTLTVTGSDGRTASAEQAVSVTAPIPAPEASFTVNPPGGDAPLTVQLEAAQSPNLTAYAWAFSDGSTATGPSASYTFANPGDYTVTLTVTGSDGRTASAEQTVSVTAPIPAPEASFTVNPPGGDAPLTVQLEAAQSPNLTAYAWTFSDGSTATGPSASYTFANPGDYTITLTVTGSDGRTASAEQAVSVTAPIPAPEAAFTVNPPGGEAPLTVQLEAAQSPNLTAYAWTFSDGGTATGPSASYTFANPGDYTVTLTVTGSDGRTASAEQAVSVTAPIPAPEASFTVNPPSGDAPLTVQLEAAQSPNLIAYAWAFSDGGTATGPSTSYTFANPGDYTVTLTVTGSDGRTASAEQAVSVTAPIPAPEASFTVNPPSGASPLTVQLEAAQSPNLTAYTWTFSDGGTATGPSTSYTFANPGDYTVTLTVTGSDGRTASAEQAVSVTAPIPAPEAAFTVNPPGGEAPLTVQFEAAQSPNLTAYAWTFSDGGTATGPSTSYTFANPGDYTVTLTVTGSDGRTASADQAVSVTAPIPAPEASFTVNPPGGEAPLTVQLEAAQSPNLTAYTWTFSDGGTATGPSTSYIFANPGDYTVTLTVTGSDGRTASAEQAVSVTAPLPPELGIATQLPILPEPNSTTPEADLRAIYERGLAQGRRASVFAKVGDELAVQTGYLTPFADPGLILADAAFQTIVDWHNQVDVGGGRSSFDYMGAAARAGWRAEDLLDPAQADATVCNPGETPLDCEIRMLQPSVALVSVGLSNVSDGDLTTFRTALDTIIQTLLDSGVIPVVSTIQPTPYNPAAGDAVNTAIIETAQAVAQRNNTTVPIYNLWRRYNDLPVGGISGDGVTPTVAPAGPGDLTPESVNSFGINARNHDILTILDLLRTRIYPDAQP